MPERADLDASKVTDEARDFAGALFSRFPELRSHAAMARRDASEEWTLVVNVPAPNGDPRVALAIWVEGGDDPSVGLGAWHTHENVWGWNVENGGERTALLDLIEGILADRYVVCEVVGDADGASATVLDLAEKDALLDELTRPGAAKRLRLRSWSGKVDREVGLADVAGEAPA